MYEMKETDNGLKVRNGGRQFQTPLMLEGQLHLGYDAVGDKLKVTGSAVRKAIKDGVPVAGKLVRLATRAEVEGDPLVYRVEDDGTVRVKDGRGPWRRPIVDGNGRLHMKSSGNAGSPVTEADFLAVYPDAVRTHPVENEEVEEPFEGAKFSDGTVVVRMTNGTDWMIARKSADDLPAEIRNRCRWLA